MSTRTAWIHPAVKAILLIGFAAYIAYLVKTDHILYFISPRMVLFVKLSALGLYAVGAYQLYAASQALFGKAESCDCGHDHAPPGSPWKNAIVYGLFAFPLLLGFLTPDTTLDSSLAAKKGMNLSSASALKTSAPLYMKQSEESAPARAELERLFPSDPFTADFAKHARTLYPLDVIPVPDSLYIETITTLDLYLDQFTGKKVELSGFVYRDETMTDRQFVVGRFSVECCSADATPFGVHVQYNRAGAYASDGWISVTGTIGKTKWEGDDLMVIYAEHIVKIDKPKEPYVYPNYEFGS